MSELRLSCQPARRQARRVDGQHVEEDPRARLPGPVERIQARQADHEGRAPVRTVRPSPAGPGWRRAPPPDPPPGVARRHAGRPRHGRSGCSCPAGGRAHSGGRPGRARPATRPCSAARNRRRGRALARPRRPGSAARCPAGSRRSSCCRTSSRRPAQEVGTVNGGDPVAEGAGRSGTVSLVPGEARVVAEEVPGSFQDDAAAALTPRPALQRLQQRAVAVQRVQHLKVLVLDDPAPGEEVVHEIEGLLAHRDARQVDRPVLEQRVVAAEPLEALAAHAQEARRPRTGNERRGPRSAGPRGPRSNRPRWTRRRGSRSKRAGSAWTRAPGARATSRLPITSQARRRRMSTSASRTPSGWPPSSGGRPWPGSACRCRAGPCSPWPDRDPGRYPHR